MPKTYNELYIAARQTLREAGIEAFALEARLLLGLASGKRQEELLRDLQLYASTPIEQKLEELCRRRAAGEPAAYLTGRWEFCGLELRVTPDTLVPRSDTELLVERALPLLRAPGEVQRVLDLGTGTGCVGLALAHFLPAIRVLLADKSPAALAVARENTERLGLSRQVDCLLLDVTEPPDPALGSFNMIVSNPPYVRSAELAELDWSVRGYEPREALDGGPDGLRFYRAILNHHLPLLRQGGWLLFEVGEDQAEQVLAMMRRAGLLSLGTAQDSAGFARVVCGRKTESIHTS